MKILAVNAGSSSLKFTLFEMPEEEILISGTFERIGLYKSFYTLKINGEKKKKEVALPNHGKAVEYLCNDLIEEGIIKSLDEIKGIGHRVTQGADKYSQSVVVNDDVIKAIEEFAPLAPLHNPANLLGIKALQEKLTKSKAVAVFDTAFHQTLEEQQFLYPIPYEYYEDYKIRKYGFHGTSHKYLTEYMMKTLNKDKINLITCHIGNGASITAVKDSKSYDTSMGFTPTAGLMMGTRAGDIDATLIPYLMKNANLSLDEAIDILNNKSGLLGISGKSSDSRDIEEGIQEGDKRSILAQNMYVERILEYIAKYFIKLEGNVDAIVFSAGVGENSKTVRKAVVEGLKALDIVLDEKANDTRGEFKLITTKESKIPVYIVPTDEEVMIARDTYRLIN